MRSGLIAHADLPVGEEVRVLIKELASCTVIAGLGLMLVAQTSRFIPTG
jgi:hypothetical protein